MAHRFINPTTGEQYDVPEGEEENARTQYGLISVAEQAAQTAAEGANLQTAAEEAGRVIASGAAGLARAVTPPTPASLTELEPGQVDRFSTGEALAGNVGLDEQLYGEEARRRREANPTAAALGGAAPTVAAGLLLPGAGWAGAAATVGVDLADAAAQAALDAELEGRGISGSDILTNAGMNLLFSGGAAALGAGARKALRGGRSVIEAAGERAARKLDARGAAADGDDLVEAMADPAARETLFQNLAQRADGLVERHAAELDSLKPVKVANNPNAQRDAIETIVDAFESSDSAIGSELRGLMKGTPRARLTGLRELRGKLDDGSDLAKAVDDTLAREELWGEAALRSEAALEAAKGLRPAPGATTEQLSGFADALRKVPGMEKAADDIDEVVGRVNEARVASTLPPPVKPKDAPKIVDDAPRRQRAIRDAVVGAREKAGALQAWSDGFSGLVSNAEKRSTFEAFEATMPAPARAQLAAESRALASKAVDVITRLPDTAQDRILGFAEALEKSGSAADMDRLKNALQGARKRYAKLTNDARAADYMSAIDELEPQLRAALENPAFVGEATAAVQKARNAAWANPDSGFIRNQARMKAAGYNLMDVVEIDYDGRALLQVDAKAFESLMGAPPEQALKVLGWWDEQLNAAASIVGTVTKGIGDGTALAKFADASKTLRAQIQDLRRLKLAEDIVSRQAPAGLGGRVLGAVARKGAGMAGTALGSAVGGPVGAVIGAGLGSVAEAAAEAGLGRAGREAFDGVTEKALRSFVAMAEASKRQRAATAHMLVSPEAARRYQRAAGDAGSALYRFQGEHESPAQAFQETRRLIDGFTKSPERFVDLLTEEFGDVGTLSPKLHREMLSQAIKVHAYLARHLPGKRNVSVIYPNGTPPSRMQIRQFALRFTAATDPDSVHIDARAGRLEKVQLDTLQELWPHEYDELRLAVLEEMGAKLPRTNARRRMSILFGFGSGVDPALGSRTRAIVMAARAEQEASQGSAPARPSRSTMPSAQSLQPAGLAALSLGSQMTF